MTIAPESIRAGIESAEKFAEVLVGQPLWDHQRDMVNSPARYRTMCAGRQVGKSRVLAIEALYTAFTKPGSLTLLVSAGETASIRLLEECASLAMGSQLLAGSVLDDQRKQLTLSTGSRIISVPASQKQIRGWPVDLLIIDEAGFVDEDIWRAAEPAVIARPGSRIILSSSPWGGIDHFFRRLWQGGMTAPDERYASFHWPSSLNPLVDTDYLADIQAREPSHYFNREYLAEWTDVSGAYFPVHEIDDAVADYELIDPMHGIGQHVVAGLDWGMSHDANAVVYLAALGDVELNAERHGEHPVFWIPAIEQHFRMPYATFIDRLVEQAKHLDIDKFMSETNGVGQMPTQVLRDRLHELGIWTPVVGRVTDVQRKAGGFGRIKVLLQQGRLVLPRHPELLKQLHHLTYEQTDAGHYKISVPENVGHDDLAMALMQAATSIAPAGRVYDDGRFGSGDLLTTGTGTKLRRQPAIAAGDHLFASGGKKV